MRTLAILLSLCLAFAGRAAAAANPGDPAGGARPESEQSRTLHWRFWNKTGSDLHLWVRILDVPWAGSAHVAEGGRLTLDAGKIGSLAATFGPSGKGSGRLAGTGKALVVMMPDGKEAGSQWLIHEFSVDDRPTIEPLVIDDAMFSRRRDVLFVRNDSAHPIRLSLPQLTLENVMAAEGKDYILRTTGDMADDSIVIRPGASAPWLVMTQLGAVGGGGKRVECSLRTEGFSGRCGLDWRSYVTGVVRFDDAVIARLDADAKALAAEMARRAAEAETQRQAAAERAEAAAAEAQARRVAAEQRRQREAQARSQQGDWLAAGALLLGILLVGDIMANDGWSIGGWSGGDEGGVCSCCRGTAYYTYKDVRYGSPDDPIIRREPSWTCPCCPPR